MNKIDDQRQQEIVHLLDGHKWDEAENALLEFCNTDDSWIYFCLGYVYDNWDNPRRDSEKARKYFSLAAESTNPVEDAFIRLSRIERNITHSIRILRKGLQSFPKSEAIYYQLLNYTAQSDREELYREVNAKEIVSERIMIAMVSTYYALQEYNKSLKVLSGIEITEEWDRNILACIKGFSLYETGEHAEAEKLFTKLIEEDINHKLNYIPNFGLIVILLDKDQVPEAEQLIEEIKLTTDTHSDAYPFLQPGPWGESYIDARKHFYSAISLILKKSKNKKIKGIARGLRGLVLYSEAFEEETTNNRLRNATIKDLEFALTEFPQNAELAKCLWGAFKETDPSKAWPYLVHCASNDPENIYELDDFIENVNDQLFNDFLKDFITKSANLYIGQKLSKYLLNPIVERLFEAKRYKDILAIIKIFNDLQLESSDVLFETAYSYFEENNLTESKKYYELYMSKKGESNAVLNNLGLIFEKNCNLLKAKELFLKAAQLNNEDQTCRRNLKRVEAEIKKKGEAEYELQEAVEKYRHESPYVQRKILNFYGHRNDDALIICSYRQAPQFLGMSGTVAVNFLNDLLIKKYLIKVTDHEYNTQSSVYKLNPYIEQELPEIEESLKSEAELLEMCERLNIEGLNLIGYDGNLIRNVTKISSVDLNSTLRRDLKENAIAVILRQNKAALVLSGSIIEAILTDRIMAKDILKYTIKNSVKCILKMDLNELLYVAEKENIIDSTMAHLAHGVRGYRNLIHPGVEQRKDTIQVNDQNVDLAWGIVKKLLSEVK